ncbi:hypothetical protein TELCIR_22495, partial [Teladorsagia circumcincta]
SDLAHVIQAEVDRQLGREELPPRFVSIPDRPYNDMRYLIDISKAEKDLDWTPTISFAEGAKREESPVRSREVKSWHQH